MADSRDRPLVVHVLPKDMARGAQVFAKVLRDRLDGPAATHRTLTLFDAPVGALNPDHSLGLSPGLLRRAGLDLRVLRRLRNALGELEPDIIVAHGGEPLKYCTLARPAGTKLVYYKIGSSRSVARHRLRSRWHHHLMCSADKVVAISDDLAAEAHDVFGVAPDRAVIIPNGRDPAPFRAADHEAKPVQLAYVGHIEAPKRPLWFVDVVRSVTAEHPDVCAVMAGDGPLLGELREATQGLPVEVLGRRDDVADILAASHVLVSPSSREGMPGVFIEAGLSAVPVVSTDVAGASTVLEDGVTGHIVPLDDLDGLTARTLDLVADSTMRRKMGEAAHQRCLDHFSVDAVADRWANLFAQLLS
jgi:glycosyltransferase involved in cell wall biosynthesis